MNYVDSFINLFLWFFFYLLTKFLFIGERTFGVLTKLDLMDKGTNALDVRSLALSF